MPGPKTETFWGWIVVKKEASIYTTLEIQPLCLQGMVAYLAPPLTVPPLPKTPHSFPPSCSYHWVATWSNMNHYQGYLAHMYTSYCL